jgi:ketosteroid isomerase-like protein
MSQENVETLRGVFDAWNARDMDAVRESYDPGVMIVRGLEGWPEPAPVVGREAVIGYFEQLRETWDSDTMEPTSDLIDVGARVVVRQLWRAVGRGPDFEHEFTVVYTFRKGKISLMEYFWDHAEALETLGLSEQDAHADS